MQNKQSFLMHELFDATDGLRDEIAIAANSKEPVSDSVDLKERVFDISTIVGLMLEEGIISFTPEELNSYTATGMEKLKGVMEEETK